MQRFCTLTIPMLCRSLLFCLGILVLAACGGPQDPSPAPTVLITGVSVRPLDRVEANGMTHFVHSDTLRTQLVFDVSTHARKLDGNQAVPTGAGNDPFPGHIANPTVPELSWFSFDRPIWHRGVEIPPHTNLLRVDAIARRFDGARLDLSFPQLSPFVIGQIHLLPSAFIFPPADYQATLRWETAAGERFGDTVRVHIRLAS